MIVIRKNVKHSHVIGIFIHFYQDGKILVPFLVYFKVKVLANEKH